MDTTNTTPELPEPIAREVERIVKNAFDRGFLVGLENFETARRKFPSLTEAEILRILRSLLCTLAETTADDALQRAREGGL